MKDEPNSLRKLPLNDYEQVDISSGVPDGLVHIKESHMGPTCRSIKVQYAPALMGLEKQRGFWKPKICGVVIFADDEPAVIKALALREKRRLSPAQKEERRMREDTRIRAEFEEAIRSRFPGMPELDVADCAWHATVRGSGRVGRSRACEYPVKAAVVAHIRHACTEYDDLLLQGYTKDDARRSVGDEIDAVFRNWQHDNESAIEE